MILHRLSTILVNLQNWDALCYFGDRICYFGDRNYLVHQLRYQVAPTPVAPIASKAIKSTNDNTPVSIAFSREPTQAIAI
ncbi:hypothetical protein H6G81_04930 [Scytonema hofmannii FACHB-248]|uniref:Uncharacterized protein n=1 Tax=Scytonema hofmannii FACHB-248 TaxID=1842502 RepID=A0ABR8GL55_9CYAN|nr:MULTISPECIES: hypothetical protein [Nostocales]MBD2603893.1 hypothetical protein [Scytonema hofmannii FACHB-248]